MFARTAFAAETKRESYAGIHRVVCGRRAVKFSGKPLRAVLNSAVQQRAHRMGLRRIMRLSYPQRAVEIARFDQRIAPVDDVQHNDQRQQQRRSHRPQQPLRPSVTPGYGESQSSGCQKGHRQIVVRVEEQRTADSNEDGSSRSAGSQQQVEERGLGRVDRPQRIRLSVAEETGDKQLSEKETEG